MALSIGNTVTAHNGSANSLSANLTTTLPNSLIMLYVATNGGPVTTVKDSANLVWTKRGTGGTTACIDEWFAVATNVLTTTITANTHSKSYFTMTALEIKGGNPTSPFNGNAVTSTNSSLNITTTVTDTLIIAASSAGYGPYTNGFTVINSGSNHDEPIQYSLFSSPQSNLLITVGTKPNGFIADAIVSAPPGPGGVVYVAPTGLDTNDGNKGTPFLTPEHARSVVSGVPGGSVRFFPGKYRLANTLSLTTPDSGTTWQADVLNSNVIISGAKPLNGWSVVSDAPTLARLNPAARGFVMSTTLANNGIALADIGTIGIRGFAVSTTSHAELSFNSQIQELARWPDANVGFAATALPINAASNSFSFTQPQPKQDWSAETDIHAYGYWQYDWADAYLPVSSFNNANNIATLGAMGPQNFGIGSGKRVYFLNLLSELSVPGEWYLDRIDGTVYFWPPSAITTDSVELSIVNGLLKTANVSNMRFQGIVLENCRGNGVNVPDGSNNNFVGCRVRNAGNAAWVLLSANSSALGCDVDNPGSSGLAISAGDRPTLTPGNITVDGCHISNFGRWERTYQPGVSVSGVGNKVTHNLIENGPHNGAKFGGNDHLFQYNKFANVVNQSSDAGAIYGGRNASGRGNQIVDNYFYDIVGYSNTAMPSAVYHDDMGCGLIVQRNNFEHVKRGVQIGGGDDNIVTDNTFKDIVGDCAITIDSRGLTWDAGLIAGIKAEVHTLPFTTAPWSTEYPTLVNIDTDNFGMPKRNVITDNIFYGANAVIKDSMDPSAEQYNTLTPNVSLPAAPICFGLPVADPNRAFLPN